MVTSTNTDFFQQGVNFGALSAGSGSDIWTYKSEFEGYSGASHGQALRATGSGTNIYASSTSGLENHLCGTHDYLLWADDYALTSAGSQTWEDSNCPLYTSDAGDEPPLVALGGPRRF